MSMCCEMLLMLGDENITNVTSATELQISYIASKKAISIPKAVSLRPTTSLNHKRCYLGSTFREITTNLSVLSAPD